MENKSLAKRASLENRIKELFVQVIDSEPANFQKSAFANELIEVEHPKPHSGVPQVSASTAPMIDEAELEDPPSFPDPIEIDEEEHSTIESLAMQRFRVGMDTPAGEVDNAFRNSPDLIGVIVQDRGRLRGIISRRKFYELLGKTFGVSLFIHRPIQLMLSNLSMHSLMMPSTSSIAETVHLALARPHDQIYDPILVSFGSEDIYLLDIHTLLLAQTNLYANMRRHVQQVNQILELRVHTRTVALQKQVTVRQHAEELLKVQLNYEKALNQCAHILLAGEDSHEIIQETMSYLMNVIRSSRVFVLEHVEDADLGSGLKLLNQVHSPHIAPIPEHFGYFPDLIWGDYFKLLWQGKPIIGQRGAADPRAKALLQGIGIVSILLIPIGEPDHWIGTVGFGETEIAREWDENEIQLLSTIAQMLYAYIERRRSALALAEARDEALRASEFKSELLAKVSHELRTPLGAVLGYSQLLYYASYGELSEDQKSAVEIVISSTKYLSTLVNGILDQAQLESGQLTLACQSFNIRQMAEDVEIRMRVLAESKGLIFAVLYSPNLPTVMLGDRMRLEQVLINILGNAVKFTDKGYIRMCFGVTEMNYLSIEISDTGAGIPVESQAKIFEPFMQVDGSLTRRFSGTGLGLSISKQLVTMMQGQIRLTSEIDKGSIFTVEIPIAPKANGID